MRGRHGSAARAPASVTPSPSGKPTSTSADCGLRLLAALVAASTVSASPTTESPIPASMSDRQRAELGVVIDYEYRCRHYRNARKHQASAG